MLDRTTYHTFVIHDSKAARLRIFDAAMTKGVVNVNVAQSFDCIVATFQITKYCDLQSLDVAVGKTIESRYVSPKYFSNGTIKSIYDSRSVELANKPNESWIAHVRRNVAEELMHCVESLQLPRDVTDAIRRRIVAYRARTMPT